MESAVQRLNGSGESLLSLRYSLAPHESVLAPLKKARTYDPERKYSGEVGRLLSQQD
jgi:hypothetical protein